LTFQESPYRKAERELGAGTDEFWEYLEAHRREDPSLCIGWALMRASRYLNIDQAAVADRTASVGRDGTVLVEPITKSFVSAMISGRSRVSPQTYTRLAAACEVNCLEFYLAEGWIQPEEIGAFSVPGREEALPILQRLAQIKDYDVRIRARAVVLAVLDSIGVIQAK
jgi:hypothetical protein